MIKKYWVYVLFAFSVVVFLVMQVTHKKQDNPDSAVKAFQVGNGWGYEVYLHNKIFLTQNNIPAVEGDKVFVSKEQALLVGNLVVEKLSHHKGLPSVTVKELDSLGIAR
ncbi:DUF4907 domain-containing protein [Parasediminibacterium sp. JCM 36343]|uniref:DUF4907 domain-containing protein n=1 Tax=Parasediminibacterium sp. JCM 36343 TaxID=3374279 RepID=UPI003979EDC1